MLDDFIMFAGIALVVEYIAGFTPMFKSKIQNNSSKYLKFIGTVFFFLGLITVYMLTAHIFPLIKEASINFDYNLIYLYVLLQLIISGFLFILGQKTNSTKKTGQNFVMLSTITLIFALVCLYLYKLSFIDVLQFIYIQTITPR